MRPRVTVQLDTRLRATVLVNPRAGHDAVAAPDIAAALEAAGVEPTVLQADGARLCAEALDAVKQGSRIIVAAGGDGTVSTVASALAGTDVALGVLPLGTLNHFVKDLHIPTDLEPAAATKHSRAQALGPGPQKPEA